MNTSALVILAVVAVVAIIAIVVLMKTRRTQKLKSRFGPEYGRAVQESGDRARAEAKLEKLEKRVDSFKLNPLSPSARAEFAAEWQKIAYQHVRLLPPESLVVNQSVLRSREPTLLCNQMELAMNRKA